MSKEQLTHIEGVPYPVKRTIMAENTGETKNSNIPESSESQDFNPFSLSAEQMKQLGEEQAQLEEQERQEREEKDQVIKEIVGKIDDEIAARESGQKPDVQKEEAVTDETGESQPPGQEPPAPPEGPTDPDGFPPDGITNSAKAYIENSNRGYYAPRKDRYFREILAENGFSEEEIDKEDAQTLFDKLSEKGRGNIRPVAVARGRQGQDELPDKPSGASTPDWNEEDQINQIRESLRRMGKEEEEIDALIEKKLQEQLQEKIIRISETSETSEEALERLKSELTTQEIRTYINNVITNGVNSLEGVANLEQLGSRARILEAYKRRVEELNQKDPPASKEEYNALLEDFLNDPENILEEPDATGGGRPPSEPPTSTTPEPEEPEDEEERNARWLQEYVDSGWDPEDAIRNIERGIPPPSERREQQGRQYDTPQQMMGEIFERLSRAETIEVFSEGSKRLLRSYVVNFRDEEFFEEQTYMQRFDEILSGDNLDTVKEQMKDLMDKLAKKYTFLPESQRDSLPESFDEFIDLVIAKESDEYGPGGLFELKDKNGNIRYENVSAWAWEKMFWWDNFSPDDPRLNFFERVSLNLNYRSISLNDFLTDRRYKRGSSVKVLLDENGRPQTDKDGRQRKVKIYEDNQEYADMVDKLTNEIWYFSQDRNFGVNYRLQMGQEKTLGEAMGEMLSSNTFTKGEGFETLFSLAGISGESYLDGENSITGEMAAVAENVYDKIYDLEKLQALLGKNSTFFRKGFLKTSGGRLLLGSDVLDDNRLIGEYEDGSKKGKGKANVRGVGIIEWSEKWYGEDDVLQVRTDRPELDWRRNQFLDYVNIFNEKIKDTYIIDEVRERIRQSLVEKMISSKPGLLEPPQNSEGIDNPNGYLYKKYSEIYGEGETEKIKKAIVHAIYHDATRAEMVAFYTAKWLGIGAMNDTTATGFDVGTKLSQTRAYRTGQGRENTIGTDLGNPRTLGIYGRLIAPVKEGLRTRGGVKLQNAIENISKNAFKMEGNKSLAREEARKLTFKSNAMSALWEDHWSRGIPVYEQVAEGQEFNLEKIIQWSFEKGFTSDPAEITKQLKDKIKQRRYLLSSYTETDYGEDIGVYTQRDLTDKEKQELADEMGVSIRDIPRFRIIGGKDNAKLGTEMLGRQVWKREFADPETGEIDWSNVRNNKGIVWKEAFLLEIAATIASHRDRMDMASPMGYMQIEAFLSILEKIPADIDVNEDDLTKTSAVYGKAFSKEMINYIRKVSKTERWRLLLMQGSWDATKGSAVGFLQAFKALTGYVGEGF